jgi:hypothetical protein
LILDAHLRFTSTSTAAIASTSKTWESNVTEVTTIQSTTNDLALQSPANLISQALASGADLDSLERLLTIQERWQKGQALNAFNEAISKAKSEIGPVFKRQTATGGAKFQFESLDDIDRQIKPILGKYGLSYRYRTMSTAEGITVVCIVAHVDGHSEENELYHAMDKGAGRNDIQSMGSSQTYLQRYSLKAALGLSASKDDDAAKSSKSTEDEMQEADWLECLRECKSIDELTTYFRAIWKDVNSKPQATKSRVIAVKDQAKKAFEKEGKS